MEWVLNPYALYGIAILGMLVHFLKKQIKGETILEIRDYFKQHFKSTIIAFISTTIAFFGYYFALGTGTPSDVVAVFGLGYTFDSVFNKWD
ncbi:MAG: hypothetical protein ACP5N7_00165 [Candidatus Pacearchaeota archaeon]